MYSGPFYEDDEPIGTCLDCGEDFPMRLLIYENQTCADCDCNHLRRLEFSSDIEDYWDWMGELIIQRRI